MNLDASKLARAVPRLRLSLAQQLRPHVERAVKEARLDTPERLAMFLAQVGHESGSFAFTKELWGPTPQQARYEPPGTLAERLGNTQPGDGKRYRGRGFIQVTGRANYGDAAVMLGLDLIDHPEMLELPEHAMSSAIWFWNSRDLNKYVPDVGEVTKRINGGYNGLDDRQARYDRALGVLR